MALSQTFPAKAVNVKWPPSTWMIVEVDWFFRKGGTAKFDMPDLVINGQSFSMSDDFKKIRNENTKNGNHDISLDRWDEDAPKENFGWSYKETKTEIKRRVVIFGRYPFLMSTALIPPGHDLFDGGIFQVTWNGSLKDLFEYSGNMFGSTVSGNYDDDQPIQTHSNAFVLSVAKMRKEKYPNAKPNEDRTLRLNFQPTATLRFRVPLSNIHIFTRTWPNPNRGFWWNIPNETVYWQAPAGSRLQDFQSFDAALEKYIAPNQYPKLRTDPNQSDVDTPIAGILRSGKNAASFESWGYDQFAGTEVTTTTTNRDFWTNWDKVTTNGRLIYQDINLYPDFSYRDTGAILYDVYYCRIKIRTFKSVKKFRGRQIKDGAETRWGLQSEINNADHLQWPKYDVLRVDADPDAKEIDSYVYEDFQSLYSRDYIYMMHKHKLKPFEITIDNNLKIKGPKSPDQFVPTGE